jgi:hypothetical protein
MRAVLLDVGQAPGDPGSLFGVFSEHELDKPFLCELLRAANRLLAKVEKCGVELAQEWVVGLIQASLRRDASLDLFQTVEK